MAAHVATKGQEIHEKYGPRIGWEQLQQLLADRTCTRYPCDLVFDAAPLLAGEFAYPLPKGDQPEEGFRMCVHPVYATQPERLAYLVLYQLVVVNYGAFASSDDAETFGAAALGLEREEYYHALCELAGQVEEAAENSGCGAA